VAKYQVGPLNRERSPGQPRRCRVRVRRLPPRHAAYCVSPSLHSLSLLRFGIIGIHNVLNTTGHVEVGFWDMVVLAFKNLLKATDGIL